ncbi:MAG TPA: ATP-binding protein [Bacteroidia bacterium]|nr:ATP-binding protein [Bacteroidia bacterium]
MKKESLIIALGSSLLISGIIYVLSILVFHTGISLLIAASNFVVCSVSVYSVYYFVVGRRLRAIHSLIAKDPKEMGDTSLDVIESRIETLLRERKEELEKIEKLERHRREFLDNVSHEMKTPLFHIQGYVSTLVDNHIDNPEIYKRYLERAEKSAERLIHILEDLDTISQLESREVSSDIEPFDIVELCQEVIESEAIDAEQKNILLVLENEMDKAGVFGDRFRIRQVFVNLIVNSIKYGKKDGKTTIRLKNSTDYVYIQVADNGIGIAKEHLSRLFERFYRVDKGRSREQGGTGLGLSIVKHILESHHQQIEVLSTEGTGTTFSFRLKKAPHHSSFSL